ncbi:MAG TPA: hypothetical protein VK003_09385, partial [Oceanobacillus sp.]|nr:hypothetical protein [Oceanobacillus sp.]
MVAKKDILNSLSEQQFREEVLIPLLKRMGFENVRLHHGPEEYGKDITYRQPSPLGATYYAVVAKVGDIMGRSSGKPTNLLMTIKEQVQQAFSMPITDVTNDQGNKVAVNQVVVWTTGRISGNAESQIADGLDPRF